MDNLPPELYDFIEDYHIHLLEVRKYEKLEEFHTDIQYVFGFLQNEERKESLAKYVTANEQAFEELSEDAYDMISVMAHSDRLVKNKKSFMEGGRNMCRAIEEMIEDGKKAGIEEGIKEGIKEGIRCANELMQQLLKDGRIDDIERVISDTEYQEQLLEEYGIRSESREESLCI